jgi:chromosome condensin MukBEF complex kleisin-like MukF subunit
MMFRLQEITAMKLEQVKVLNKEIDYAQEKGWKAHEAECQKELTKTKYEAMHPQEVLNALGSKYQTL